MIKFIIACRFILPLAHSFIADMTSPRETFSHGGIFPCIWHIPCVVVVVDEEVVVVLVVVVDEVVVVVDWVVVVVDVIVVLVVDVVVVFKTITSPYP